jgi:hypothetical protein
MNKIPFRNQPRFISLLLGVVLLGIFLFYIIKGGGLYENALGFVLDIVLLAILYQICMFFYAQFILPTRSLEERRRIAARLHLHAFGGHGPAIFIRNGRKVERTGESEKTGPGLLWVDTASAVVTRTPSAFKQVLGPGVHFIEANERIDTVISLHVQNQTLGPTGPDDPFEKPKERPTEDERAQYVQMKARCMAVRATTRDGHEIYPTLGVTFRIDAKPAAPGEKGSRFGFNAASVERAARSEGINPNSITEEKRRVPWNQLPGLMAVELWREYLSKFTLNELFEPNQKSLPNVPQPDVPPSMEAPAPPPLVVRRDYRSRLLRRFNNDWETTINRMIPLEEPAAEEELAMAPAPRAPRPELQGLTALQVINQMIKARLSQEIVVRLDECGRITDDRQPSLEHRKLTERGIVVLNASVSALYLDPEAERDLLNNWTTSWFANAREDQRRIERLHTAYAEQGKYKALLDHALALSEAINKERPATLQAAVKMLLQKTAAEIRMNERLQGLVRNELELLEDLEQWAEEKQP